MSFPRYERYKESGVEWLGEVPVGWEVKRLRYITDCLDGKRVPLNSEQRADKQGDIPYWGANSIVDYVDEALFNEELVLLGEDGAPFFDRTRPVAFLVRGQVWPNNHVHVLRPSISGSGHFMTYALNVTDYSQFIDGSTRDKLTQSSMAEIPIPWPNEIEQHTIAAFLDRETGKIDELVAEQERLIALLKEKRQATISHTVTKGLNPDAPMKDSGIVWLGAVPVGWEVKRFKALVSSIKAGPFGSALTKDMYVSDGYRVYGQEQVIPGDFTVGDYFISNDKFIELQQYQIAPGDILISCVGTFGKIAIVPKDIVPGIINPRLMRVRCAETVSGEYLATLLRSDAVFEQFSFLSRGGTMDIINIGILSEIFLVVPPIKEQTAITAFLDNETAKIDTLVGEARHAIDLLKERRCALISAAVTGKINVKGLAY